MTEKEIGQLGVLISGLVQGVGFRHHTMMKAKELGLTGWVRNRAEGRVEAVFEGGHSQLSAMLEWCQRGPHLSEVRSVEAKHGAATGAFSGFEIRF